MGGVKCSIGLNNLMVYYPGKHGILSKVFNSYLCTWTFNFPISWQFDLINTLLVMGLAGWTTLLPLSLLFWFDTCTAWLECMRTMVASLERNTWTIYSCIVLTSLQVVVSIIRHKCSCGLYPLAAQITCMWSESSCECTMIWYLLIDQSFLLVCLFLCPHVELNDSGRLCAAVITHFKAWLGCKPSSSSCNLLHTFEWNIVPPSLLVVVHLFLFLRYPWIVTELYHLSCFCNEIGLLVPLNTCKCIWFNFRYDWNTQTWKKTSLRS